METVILSSATAKTAPGYRPKRSLRNMDIRVRHSQASVTKTMHSKAAEIIDVAFPGEVDEMCKARTTCTATIVAVARRAASPKAANRKRRMAKTKSSEYLSFAREGGVDVPGQRMLNSQLKQTYIKLRTKEIARSANPPLDFFHLIKKEKPELLDRAQLAPQRRCVSCAVGRFSKSMVGTAGAGKCRSRRSVPNKRRLRQSE